jgi:hypothetical protein
MEKTIDCYEVTVTFNVRKGSHEAHTLAQLKKNVRSGIGFNDMECIEAEDIKIKITS